MADDLPKRSLTPHRVMYDNVDEALSSITGGKPQQSFEMKDMSKNVQGGAHKHLPEMTTMSAEGKQDTRNTVNRQTATSAHEDQLEERRVAMFKQLKNAVTRKVTPRTVPLTPPNLAESYRGAPYQARPYPGKTNHFPRRDTTTGSTDRIEEEESSTAGVEADTYDQKYLHHVAGAPKAKYSTGICRAPSVNEGSTVDAVIQQYSNDGTEETFRNVSLQSDDEDDLVPHGAGPVEKTAYRSATLNQAVPDHDPAVIPGSHSFTVGSRTGPATVYPLSDVLKYGATGGETLIPIVPETRRLLREPVGKAPDMAMPLPPGTKSTYHVGETTMNSTSCESTYNLLDLTGERAVLVPDQASPDATEACPPALPTRSDTNPFRKRHGLIAPCIAPTQSSNEVLITPQTESSLAVHEGEDRNGEHIPGGMQRTISMYLHRASAITDGASNYATSLDEPASPVAPHIYPRRAVNCHDVGGDTTSLGGYYDNLLDHGNVFSSKEQRDSPAPEFYAGNAIPTIWQEDQLRVRVPVIHRQDSYDIIGLPNSRREPETNEQRAMESNENDWETVRTGGPTSTSRTSGDRGPLGLRRTGDSVAGYDWNEDMENQDFDAPTRDLASFSSRERILTHPVENNLTHTYRERKIDMNGGPSIPVRLPVYNNPYSLQNSSRPFYSAPYVTDSPYLEDQEYASLENANVYQRPQRVGGRDLYQTRNLTLELASSAASDRSMYNHSPEGYIPPTIKRVQPSQKSSAQGQNCGFRLQYAVDGATGAAHAAHVGGYRSKQSNTTATSVRHTNKLHSTVQKHLTRRSKGPEQLEEVRQARPGTSFSAERKRYAQNRIEEIMSNVSNHRSRPLSQGRSTRALSGHASNVPRMTTDGHEYARRVNLDKFVAISPKIGIMHRPWRFLYGSRQLAEIDNNAAHPPMHVDTSGFAYPSSRELVIDGAPKLCPVPGSDSEFSTRSEHGRTYRISIITLIVCAFIPFMLAAFTLGWLDAMVPCLTSGQHTRLKANHKRWAWMILAAEVIVGVVAAILAAIVYRLQHH